MTDELAGGNGLEARLWPRLTPRQPGAVEESLLKAHYEPGGGLQQPRLRLSGSGTERNAARPGPLPPVRTLSPSPRTSLHSTGNWGPLRHQVYQLATTGEGLHENAAKL